MRQGAAVEIDAESTRDPEGMRQHEGYADWQTVDRALRTLARRRAVLDAEEARWLREAEACQIWRPLGMVSALDYMERVLGYGPRAAQERLRVARALGTLPQLTAALAHGELPFSAVRELTRVATPATEAAWRDTAMGKNLRQIEELVADHRPGDHPDDPADPEARTHVVRFELSAETFALLRQTRTVLDSEHGSHLSDDQLVATLCGTVLDGAPTTEPTGRARFQIAVTVCERCRQGWQEGAGAKIAISPAAVERATCDAQHIGSIDGAIPERAHQDISPSVARFVWRRDGGRCRIPGCRSARGLELHHLVHRIDGGSHDASNVVLACSSCHQAHHAGKLIITGTAELLEVRRPAQSRALAESRAHVGAVAEVNAAPDAVAHTNATPDAGTNAIAHTNARPSPGTDAITHASTRPDAITHASARAAGITDARPDASAATCKLEAAVLRAQAKEALVGLGWKPAIANAAAAASVAALGTATTLDRLIFDALRRCARPPG
jgi:hypothetical protein